MSAPDPTRTGDRRIRRPLLYPLSYGGRRPANTVAAARRVMRSLPNPDTATREVKT